MLASIIDFKKKIEDFKNRSLSATAIDKGTLCKLLVMANIAEMVIHSNTQVPIEDKVYFEGQAFVGRYFDDWNEHWITDYYFKITQNTKSNHWQE